MKTDLSLFDSHASIGLANIMRLAFNGDNLEELTAQLLNAIQSDANNAAALLDLAIVLQLNAQPQLALELQSEALKQQQHFRLSSNPDSASIRLLSIMAPGEVMANTPIEFLVEGADIALELLYLGEGIPTPAEIPEHDLAFVCVCESDQSQPLLQQLDAIMQHWPRPFINSPANIARLSRNAISKTLADAEGVVASDARRMPRRDFSDLQQMETHFPLIARPVNSHAGHGLEKIDNSSDLTSYLRNQVEAEFFVAPFIDYRSEDGWYRKYRIVLIDGRPYPSHMAISKNWMVHYLNADMLQNEKNRAEEARFMETFDTGFADLHREALREIDRRVGLEYYSIDCAETKDGRLLVFEIDSGAVVHSMDPVDIFPYKAPHMKRVFDAFQQLLHRRMDPSGSQRAA